MAPQRGKAWALRDARGLAASTDALAPVLFVFRGYTSTMPTATSSSGINGTEVATSFCAGCIRGVGLGLKAVWLYV